MHFSSIVSFAVTVTGLVGAALAQAPLVPGQYRILNGGQSARSFPSAAQQGPFEVAITFSNQFASVWENWQLISDGGDGFFIQSVGTRARAFATPVTGEQVVAASDRSVSWLIQGGGQTPDGEDLYTVKLSAGDFLWTNTPRNGEDNVVTLQGSDGSSSQRFIFQRI
ncbi:hypothetical protein NP233_g3956 [Leucocoprinus birnbaumii]|uniref:Ricin B lectin domain-containing protein n=1 Tax=Leucocoprinus birnbaumii TaxID=56174 RepID=A0AAD5VZC7_9AGAR|nr:hypothetical protein NP233_g3956 [Leucocoprinus birnbaumii]